MHLGGSLSLLLHLTALFAEKEEEEEEFIAGGKVESSSISP